MPELKRNMIFRGTNLMKKAYERVLRDVFASDIVDKRFRYDTDDEKSKIAIYRAYPQRLEKFPAIIISTGAWNADLVSMGIAGEEMEEVIVNGKLVSQVFSGYMRVPVTLRIFSLGSTEDREVLTDILIMILRILSRGQFAKFGIGFHQIAIGGEDQFAYDTGQMVYTNSLTIENHTDFSLVSGVDETMLIDKVSVYLYGFLKPEDTPKQLHPTESPIPPNPDDTFKPLSS